MAYDNMISRGDVQATIPEQVSNELLETLEAQSAALALFRTVRMSTNQTRMPVLSALPQAYWVTGDTGLKQTTEIAWTSKYLNVEELAAIVPIPEAVADDMSFNVWDNVRPLLSDAIVRAFDSAVFLGVNKPASWPEAIVTGAIAAGHDVESTATFADMPGKLSDLFSFVEDDGYMVDFVLANPTKKGILRKVALTQLENPNNPGLTVNPNNLYGVDVTYPMPGLWLSGTGAAEFIVGSRREGIIGLRQDMQWRVLDQAAIFDNNGDLIFNFAQQDMVGLRVTFRGAYQIANTIKYQNTNDSTRFPFAVMTTP